MTGPARRSSPNLSILGANDRVVPLLKSSMNNFSDDMLSGYDRNLIMLARGVACALDAVCVDPLVPPEELVWTPAQVLALTPDESWELTRRIMARLSFGVRSLTSWDRFAASPLASILLPKWIAVDLDGPLGINSHSLRLEVMLHFAELLRQRIQRAAIAAANIS